MVLSDLCLDVPLSQEVKKLPEERTPAKLALRPVTVGFVLTRLGCRVVAKMNRVCVAEQLLLYIPPVLVWGQRWCTTSYTSVHHHFGNYPYMDDVGLGLGECTHLL